MAKGTLTKEELENKKKQLTDEIEKLTKFISSSDTSTFEIMIDDIKQQMYSNIAEEDWKSMKVNKGKIEEIRNVSKIIQNQSELLEEKKDELEDVIWELEHYQISVFEQHANPEFLEPEDTGYMANGKSINTGDIFQITGDAEISDRYVLIKKSSDIKDSYAMISNFFEGEACLQYPKNFNILNEANYLGNIYNTHPDDKYDILSYASIIADYQTSLKENTD